MKYRAFICHETKTGEDFAVHLGETLEDNGIPAFVDSKHLLPGLPWPPTRDAALDNCDYFIVVGTEGVFRRDWGGEGEIKRAEGQGKRLLPFRNKPVDRDKFLKLFKTPNLQDEEFDTKEDLARKVLNSLKGLEREGAKLAPYANGMTRPPTQHPSAIRNEFLREQAHRLGEASPVRVIADLKAWLKREKRANPDRQAASSLLALAYIKQGQQPFQKGEFRQAQGLYQKALENARRTGNRDLEAIAAYELGAAWGRLGYHDEALKQLNRVIALKPDMAPAYYNRGNAYAGKGDFDRAIADYTQAIELDPKDAAAYNNRGAAYADRKKQGDLDAAIADYSEAIRLDPKYAQAYYNRGVAYADRKKEGDLDAAIADYDRAIQLDPKYAQAYSNRGVAYAKRKKEGDLDAAIADYSRAIQLDPKDAQAYNNRGNAYFAKEDFAPALADYDTAIQLDPNYAAAMANKGFAFLAKGNRRQGRLWLRRALEHRNALPDSGAMVEAALAQLEKKGG